MLKTLKAHRVQLVDGTAMVNIGTEDGWPVALVLGGDMEADTVRRIVAAWNACLGIATADLELVAAGVEQRGRLEALGTVANTMAASSTTRT